MRLVFLHGIHQDGKDPEALKQAWIEDLETGIGRRGALDGCEVQMPFFGNELVAAAQRGPGAIAQGLSAAEDRELALFLAEGLEEQARSAGASGADIAREQEAAATAEVVPMGFPMNRRINAIVSLLEKLSPFRGDVAVRLLAQAHAYLRKPHVRRAVDELVARDLQGEPAVVVSHSLGTIVGFSLLRRFAQENNAAEVPLFVTMGSPLTLSTVQRAINPPFANPPGVERWLNLRDPDDFISLNRGLDAPPFSGPIENVGDFENPGEDAHAIPGYLTHRPTALAIAEALGL